MKGVTVISFGIGIVQALDSLAYKMKLHKTLESFGLFGTAYSRPRLLNFSEFTNSKETVSDRKHCQILYCLEAIKYSVNYDQ